MSPLTLILYGVLFLALCLLIGGGVMYLFISFAVGDFPNIWEWQVPSRVFFLFGSFIIAVIVAGGIMGAINESE